MPKVIIFAGANGSGKTTLAHSTLKQSMSYINADEIKFWEKLTSIEAGKRALALIDKNISQKENFSFETTMAGLLLLNRFKELKKKEYSITIFYLFAYPLDLLVERIKERVKKGGHAVEYQDIIRRYYRSVKNFWNIYRKYSDEWGIVLNNEYEYKNIAMGKKESYNIVNEAEFDKFKEALRHDKR